MSLNNKAKFKLIFNQIKKYQNIVIVRHVGPDPDAIASQIALRDSIKLTFNHKNVYAIGKSVARFKCYGQLDKIEGLNLKQSLLIVCDVPNVARIDDANPSEYGEVIQIDHHPFEDDFASIKVSDVNYCSTCEIIANLILSTKLKLNHSIARNLYMGIVADSERFLYKTTTANTFKTVTQLIEKTNLDFTDAYNDMYMRPLNETKFQAHILENMNVSPNGFGYLLVTKEMLDLFNVDVGMPSNLVNNFNFIKEVIAWCLVVHDDDANIYKVNIRSRGPIINNVAALYHGGGHKFAAGARISTKEDVDKLFNDLDQACKVYMDEQNENI